MADKVALSYVLETGIGRLVAAGAHDRRGHKWETLANVPGATTATFLTGAGSQTITRHPQHGLITATTLGAVADSWSYNGFGELSSYTATANGAPIFSTSYTRDNLGRIVTKTETIDLTTDTYTYHYDPAGRLESVEQNGVEVSRYSYDENGNRESYVGTLGQVTEAETSYDAQDRLTGYGDATYTYTPNGELATKSDGSGTTTYTYDVLGNLIAVELPDGTDIEYVIDGRNRRVGKKVNGALVQVFLYADQLNPIAELDGSGNLVSRFVYGTSANVPDFVIRGGTTYRIISDHLGSPRLIVDSATGAVAQRVAYAEFGSVVADTNPAFQPFGFAGGLYDQHTKLLRFGARDYDATSARWTAKDPILFDGRDGSLYGYAFGDPINFLDSDGLCPFNRRPGDLPYPGAGGGMPSGIGGRSGGDLKQPAGGAVGRGGAFNAAKRHSGIPTSQQPDRVRNVPDRQNPGKTIREYDFEVPRPGGGPPERRTIRDDFRGHSYPDNPSQNRGPHFNTPDGAHFDYLR